MKFCPIPGMWGHRIYKFLRDYNGLNLEQIHIKAFLTGLRNLCRSEDLELDYFIFQMFDLCENKNFISASDITTMLINMPDIGFSNS